MRVNLTAKELAKIADDFNADAKNRRGAMYCAEEQAINAADVNALLRIAAPYIQKERASSK